MADRDVPGNSMLTPYHAKYFAHDLTRRSAVGELDRLSMALFDAQVDLNPHQVEAALFALKSPLSKGVVLADEVGLGKTIEAGIVLCQKWAERQRRLIVVCPAAIRKQWALELQEKFQLPATVLDEKAWRTAEKAGTQPLQCGKVVVMSYHFASRRKDELRAVAWDLVVLDEAHKLRNCYRPKNRMGQAIRWAFGHRRKLLLTATPMQNSLLELYGLSCLLDEHIFSDKTAFQARYCSAGGDLDGLRQRMSLFCKRTLRKDVLEYVRYTKRRALCEQFHPEDDEHQLYVATTELLYRENSYALPNRQRHLTALLAQKLLASSPIAIAGTLEAIHARLTKIRDGMKDEENTPIAQWAEEEELDLDELEEMLEEAEEEIEGVDETDAATATDEPRAINVRQLREEIEELERLIKWARSIRRDTKCHALLKALARGFEEMQKLGAKRKALVFTESRRTQEYLANFLQEHGYRGKVIIFNGTNTHPEAQATLDAWLRKHGGTDRVTGSRSVDVRTALIDCFADDGEILIATEAAAEGVNLQFCSLVINYDLPWNPQRIEQRIGRCHRYGQKFDVVVFNFLNSRNEADQRVYEILNEKLRLFDGLFGASDEVLGAIEGGVDFEKRVVEILRTCRTPGAIEAAFNKLREDLDEQIQRRMKQTHQQLLEYFDSDVHERLRLRLAEAEANLDRFGRRFWQLSQHQLDSRAKFHNGDLAFDLTSPPFTEAPAGRYHLIRRQGKQLVDGFDGHLYRLSHPLGQWVLEQGKASPTPLARVVFQLTGNPRKVSVLEPLRGCNAWLVLQKLTITAADTEEFLLFSGVHENGRSIDPEVCEKLFELAARIDGQAVMPDSIAQRLEAEATRHAEATQLKSDAAQQEDLRKAQERLDEWADDFVIAEERKLDDMRKQQRALRKQAREAPTLDAQLQANQDVQKHDRALQDQEAHIKKVRDEAYARRDELIEALSRRLQRQSSRIQLFTISFTVT